MPLDTTKNDVVVINSIKQMEKLGFVRSNIYQCINKKRKTHKGYTWSKI